MTREGFISYLESKALISKEGLEKVLEFYREKKGSLVELLVKLGYFSEQKILNILSEYLNIPPIKILNLNVSKEILELVPKEIAQHYLVFPIGKIGNVLTLAMADPLDILVLDDLRKITGCQINPVIVLLSEIKEAISNFYSKIEEASLEEVIKEESTENLEIIKESSVEEKEISLDEAPVIKFFNSIIKKAAEDKASDILIEPLENNARLRFRIDGVLREIQRFSKGMLSPLISRIKVICNLNIAEHRLPQEGRFTMKILDRNIDFRVSILPSSLGEKAAIRILDKSTALLDINLLGFEKDVLDKIKEDSLKPHGLILVCGPTGCGKTTTLYSIINYIYTVEKNIVTVEDPIEYQLKGVNQVSINPLINLTFASCLRSILRQDPDIIMVGEIRDSETADIAIKAALTGHLVLSTLHTTTACGSITRLINMGVEPFLISSTLIGIVAQRLVRRLCSKCKEEFSVSEDVKEKYGLAKDVKLYRGKGCENCQGLGYKGRIALCEYLSVSSKIKSLINISASESTIKREARLLGMKTLREDSLIKVSSAITTLEEVLRVTAADEPI